MSLIDELPQFGVDTEDALARFMDNKELFERMFKKLPKVVDDAKVLPFIESGDIETALSNAHTLKGVMGNLSVMPLYRCYSDAVNLFREGRPAEAKKLVDENIELQRNLIDCITKYM